MKRSGVSILLKADVGHSCIKIEVVDSVDFSEPSDFEKTPRMFLAEYYFVIVQIQVQYHFSMKPHRLLQLDPRPKSQKLKNHHFQLKPRPFPAYD